MLLTIKRDQCFIVEWVIMDYECFHYGLHCFESLYRLWMLSQ
jgi:hypothetical protein